jgi:hypothetical protein
VTARSALLIASRWLTGFLLAIVLAAFFLAVTGVQITSEATAQRVIRRTVAVVTDVDLILPRAETELHKAAAQGQGDQVRVPGFPIPIDIPRSEAAAIQGQALRDRLLDASAHLIYDQGMSVWAQNDLRAEQRIEDVSSTGALYHSLGLVRDSTHTALVIVAILLGLLALGLALLLLIGLRLQTQLLVLGVVIAVAALPSLAGAVALRFALRTAGSDADPFVSGLMNVGVDSTWVPIRNFLTLSALGFAVIATAGGLLWWQSRAGPGGQPARLHTAP